MNIYMIIIPFIILFIIIYGLYKKIDIYDLFIEGSKEGLKMTFNLFPCILGMLLAINILIKSNLLMDILESLNILFKVLPFPKEVFPLMIMRPISGTASLTILDNLLKSYGPDSYIGRLASILQGSTDTTIYILGLYFGSIGIKKTKYALPVGLLSDIGSALLASFFVRIFF